MIQDLTDNPWEPNERLYLGRSTYAAAITEYMDTAADGLQEESPWLCFEHGHLVNGVLVFSVGITRGPAWRYWICRYDGHKVEVLYGPIEIDGTGETQEQRKKRWWSTPKPTQSEKGDVAFQNGFDNITILRGIA